MKLNEQEMFEWYLSGNSGGRDGKGVAVRYNLESRTLEPDSNFRQRADEWSRLNHRVRDRYSLDEMPTQDLRDAYIQGNAVYNLDTRRIELNPCQAD